MVQLLNDAPNTPKNSFGNIYRALREYNSGSINVNNLSDGKGATDGYVSNMVRKSVVRPIAFALTMF